MNKMRIYVKTRRGGPWISGKDTDFIAVRMSGAAFRRFRQYHPAGPAIAFAYPEEGDTRDSNDLTDAERDEVRRMIARETEDVPDMPADAEIPGALRRAIEMYRANMPEELDSGDVVRIDEISDERAELKRYVGQYAMVAAVLPLRTQHEWCVVLMLVDDSTDPPTHVLLELPLSDVRLTAVDAEWPAEKQEGKDDPERRQSETQAARHAGSCREDHGGPC